MPVSTVLVPLLRDAGPAGCMGQLFQYVRKYNAENPKQGSKRFNYIATTKYIVDLDIIYPMPGSVTEPPLFWAAPAPDGRGPVAGSGSDLLGSAQAPYTKNFHFKLSKSYY